MMKPNDFCVNDVNYHCVWGSRTSWEALNEIQKKRRDKIVFSGTLEERGEGSCYAWFRDDEAGINYLVAIPRNKKPKPEKQQDARKEEWKRLIAERFERLDQIVADLKEEIQ